MKTNEKSQTEPLVNTHSKNPSKKKNFLNTLPEKFQNWISFFKDVRVEMKKVTWPPRKEVIGSTTALIVATVMIALFLGVADLVLGKGIEPALSGNPDAWSFATLGLFAFILFWVYKSN